MRTLFSLQQQVAHIISLLPARGVYNIPHICETGGEQLPFLNITQWLIIIIIIIIIIIQINNH